MISITIWGWSFGRNHRVTLAFRNAPPPWGGIITTLAWDEIRRYSIYSQVQPCDLKISPLLNISWPIVDGIGYQPANAQKIVALGGHPFWPNQLSQDDSYTLDALAHRAPSKVRLYISNSLDTAVAEGSFDTWPAAAHVHANQTEWEMGYFRSGSSSSPGDDFIPLLPRA